MRLTFLKEMWKQGQFWYPQCFVPVKFLDSGAYGEVLYIASFLIAVQKHNYSFQNAHGKKTAGNAKLSKSGLLCD